jgi:single stranded DNA-binding protein
MNINTVHMTGNLTDDPELRYTPSGKPVVSASIANNEHYTDAQGEEKKVTTFVNLQIWGKPAENFGNLVKKGQEIFIDGKLRMEGLAQQRYVKSHRILANSRCVKDLRRFRNSQDGTWFSRSVWGLDSNRVLEPVLREVVLSQEIQMPPGGRRPWVIACSNSSRLAGSSISASFCDR